MDAQHRTCRHCGTALAPGEAFCSNCGRRYDESAMVEPTTRSTSSSFSEGTNPVQQNSEPTLLATPSPTPSGRSSGYTSSGQAQYATPPPAPYPPYNGPGYGQQPTPGYAPQVPPAQPPARKGPNIGLIVGIVALVVIVIAASTGIFLFVKGQGNGNKASSTPAGPTRLHITPYIYSNFGDQIEAVSWPPNGKYLAAGSFDNTVQVWDALNGGNVFTYRGHKNDVNALAWSPDSSYIASGSGDSGGTKDNTVQVWQPK